MELNTALFNRGINFLSKIRGNRIFRGLVLFYTKDMKMIAECTSSSGVCYRIIVAENVSPVVEFSVIVQKLQALLKGYDKDTFELEPRANNLYVKADKESLVGIYGTQGSIPKIPDYEDKPIQELGFSLTEISGLLKSYLASVSKSEELYLNVYIKDKIRVFNKRCLRVTKAGFEFPYAIFLDYETFNLVTEMSKMSKAPLTISFYGNRYEIKNDQCSIICMRKENLEKWFEEEVAPIDVLGPDTYFRFNKGALDGIKTQLAYFLKDTNNAVYLDLQGGKLRISGSEDNIEIPITFEVNGNFETKKLNLLMLTNIMEHCAETVTVRCDENRIASLYIENDIEYAGMSVLDDE